MRDPSVRNRVPRGRAVRIQTYLLVERAETEITTLFVVAKGLDRGSRQGHDHVDSSAAYIHSARRFCVRSSMRPTLAYAPAAEVDLHALPRPGSGPVANHRAQACPERIAPTRLLLIRCTGLRIGELVNLELDCVHEILTRWPD